MFKHRKWKSIRVLGISRENLIGNLQTMEQSQTEALGNSICPVLCLGQPSPGMEFRGHSTAHFCDKTRLVPFAMVKPDVCELDQEASSALPSPSLPVSPPVHTRDPLRTRRSSHGAISVYLDLSHLRVCADASGCDDTHPPRHRRSLTFSGKSPQTRAPLKGPFPTS